MASDTDAQAWIDDVEINGGTVYDAAIDNFVQKLKTDGIWSKIAYWYFFDKAGSQQAATTDVKALLSGFLVGATFNDSGGILGDGVDDYFNTRFVPSNDGVIYQQDSAFFCIGIPTDDNLIPGERIGGLRTGIEAWSSGNIRYEINGNGDDSSDAPPANGFILSNRSSSTDIQIYRNGSQLNSETNVTSQSLYDSDVYALARNSSTTGGTSSGTFRTGYQRYQGAGASLTSAEVSNLYDAVEQYYVDVEIPPGILTEPILVDGVAQAGVDVEFIAYDATDKTGRTVLQTVSTDANGVATLTVDVPVGKVLFLRASYPDGSTVWGAEQFFTDTY